jgi:hypothetical protein
MKNIGVSSEAWKDLSLIKLREGFKTLGITLDYVLEQYKKKGGNNKNGIQTKVQTPRSD